MDILLWTFWGTWSWNVFLKLSLIDLYYLSYWFLMFEYLYCALGEFWGLHLEFTLKIIDTWMLLFKSFMNLHVIKMWCGFWITCTGILSYSSIRCSLSSSLQEFSWSLLIFFIRVQIPFVFISKIGKIFFCDQICAMYCALPHVKNISMARCIPFPPSVFSLA